MAILVVGSVTFDTISTPAGQVEEVLGGSAAYFLVAAARYDSVKLITAVGDDFPNSWLRLLESFTTDLRGVQIVPGKTFRWSARYSEDWNHRQTLKTELNVFATFRPVIPSDYQNASFLFLANMQPKLQLDVLRQVGRVSMADNKLATMGSMKMYVLDSMNLWIQSARDELMEVLKHVDVLLLNDEEVHQLAETSELSIAAQRILSLGLQWLVIKRGSYGVRLFAATGEDFVVPAYTLETICDPTGAGDAFAGGFLGHLSCRVQSRQALTAVDFWQALVHGNIMGSFACEGFSINRLCTLTRDDIDTRYREFMQLMQPHSGTALASIMSVA